MRKLTEYLSSGDCKKVLMETLSNTVMWSFLGSPILAEDGGLSVYTIDGLYSLGPVCSKLDYYYELKFNLVSVFLLVSFLKNVRNQNYY